MIFVIVGMLLLFFFSFLFFIGEESAIAEQEQAVQEQAARGDALSQLRYYTQACLQDHSSRALNDLFSSGLYLRRAVGSSLDCNDELCPKEITITRRVFGNAAENMTYTFLLQSSGKSPAVYLQGPFWNETSSRRHSFDSAENNSIEVFLPALRPIANPGNDSFISTYNAHSIHQQLLSVVTANARRCLQQGIEQRSFFPATIDLSNLAVDLAITRNDIRFSLDLPAKASLESQDVVDVSVDTLHAVRLDYLHTVLSELLLAEQLYPDFHIENDFADLSSVDEDDVRNAVLSIDVFRDENYDNRIVDRIVFEDRLSSVDGEHVRIEFLRENTAPFIPQYPQKNLTIDDQETLFFEVYDYQEDEVNVTLSGWGVDVFGCEGSAPMVQERWQPISLSSIEAGTQFNISKLVAGTDFCGNVPEQKPLKITVSETDANPALSFDRTIMIATE